MPTTFAGLLLFILFLVPGLVHYTVRRGLAPAHVQVSALVETAQLVTVSTAVNTVVLAAFGVLRTIAPIRAHTLDLGRLLAGPSEYVLAGSNERLAYVFVWTLGFLAVACGPLPGLVQHGTGGEPEPRSRPCAAASGRDVRGGALEMSHAQRVVLAARDIERIDVAYVLRPTA
jgi:hypothetical protein